jgi:hypothetical protein
LLNEESGIDAVIYYVRESTTMTKITT